MNTKGTKYYFFNKYIDLYCVIDETWSVEDITTIEEMGYQVIEVPMPEYITPDYDGGVW